MNDERLTDLLGSLRYERIGRGADARIRQRLEEEWASRHGGRTAPRRLAFAFALVALAAALTFGTITAPGDSPLYALRIAVEDAAAVLYRDPAARAQYLLSLYEQRQAEAARLEAVGSAASSGVRRIELRTLEALRALLPQAPEEETPVVSASPTPSPTPESITLATPTPSPTATPSPTSRPAPTAAPTAARTPTPTPVRPSTPPPTAKPTPTPTVTATLVVLSGGVAELDGRAAVEACVSVTAGQCQTRTTTAGTYKLAVSAKVGQTVTVYAWRTDASGRITHKGSASAVVRGSAVAMPAIVLRVQ